MDNKIIIVYKKINVLPNTLFVAISQSGETADTISSLKKALKLNYSDTLAICNVAESTLTRLSNLNFLMNAGPEISVASTKAFLGQILILYILALKLALWRKDIEKNNLFLNHLFQSCARGFGGT